MKITAPEGEENRAKLEKNEIDLSAQEEEKTFLQEIKLLLQMPEISPKYIADGVDMNSTMFKLEVLKKFTAICRDEVIPRHKLVADTIESKVEELLYKTLVQQKELAYLSGERKKLEESRLRLEAAKALAQSKHEELSDRLKETLHILKNQCRIKTIAEKKMVEDLFEYQKKADNLKVGLTSLSAKVNYFSTQVNSQTETTRKQTKALYLDKNRAVFMRTNLNNMRINIEQMVHRLKALKNEMEELEPIDTSSVLKD